MKKETYEVMECVDKRDWGALPEELGDVLLHVLFQTDIAEFAGDVMPQETQNTRKLFINE